MRTIRIVLFVAMLILLAQPVRGECLPNPSGETAVGLQNASSYFLTFYIDGVNVGGVPPGDRSLDFVVIPGEHMLEAEAVIVGGRIMASHTGVVQAGFVCTWIVTDPDQLQIFMRVSAVGH
jgi:hypothetical protein